MDIRGTGFVFGLHYSLQQGQSGILENDNVVIFHITINIFK
jgi:hypothetical protein